MSNDTLCYEHGLWYRLVTRHGGAASYVPDDRMGILGRMLRIRPKAASCDVPLGDDAKCTWLLAVLFDPAILTTSP